MLIHIIGRKNSAGLSEDIEILTEILEQQGWTVLFSDYKSFKRFYLRPGRRRYDLNIFLQWANPTWMKQARRNILIPNPEWFKKKWEHVIPRFDAVFCKTREAKKIFASRTPRTVFTSFTSRDRQLPGISKKPNQWLHLAGKSKLKGTQAIINTWQANPDFPHLTLIRRNVPPPAGPIPNLTCISHFIPSHQLTQLINQCPVHLCPSATEGFGHTMGEALSCGGVIITTDAPPMNELVTGERGFLIPPATCNAIKLATAHHIDEKGLEKTVRQVLSAPHHERLMKNARRFFVSNDLFFKREIIIRIKEVMTR